MGLRVFARAATLGAGLLLFGRAIPCMPRLDVSFGEEVASPGQSAPDPPLPSAANAQGDGRNNTEPAPLPPPEVSGPAPRRPVALPQPGIAGAAAAGSVNKPLAPPPAPQEVKAEPIPPPPGVPSAPAGAAPLAKNEPSPGEPLALHVDDLDVRKVFELLSRQAKMSILISPNVTGRVTLDLRDMSVEEAVQAVAQLCHLTVRRERDLMYVSTLVELEQGEDFRLRVYHLNYVRGNDMQKMIKPLLSKRGVVSASPDSEIGIKSEPDKAGGNSPGGGDTLVVQDCERVLKATDRLIEEVDVQPVQILIEAVILTVELDDTMDLGINFSVLDGAGQAATVLGSGTALNAAAGFIPSSVITTAGKLVGSPTSGLAEDVPGLKFGFVANTVTGFIRALQTVGKTEILACPRLLVVNKQRAELQLGDRLGYMSTTQTQTSTTQTVQFMDIGTQLRLRPFVTCDGIVRMEIHPEKSSGQLNNAGIPQTSTAQVTTNVMVPDGATIVIGGLIETEKDSTETGIPVLSRLPVVGFLFRHTLATTTRKELIVILTPHIWKPCAPACLNSVVPPACPAEARARAGVVPSPKP